MVKFELNRNAFGVGLGIVAVLYGALGAFWHGPMGQPTMMAFMYSGFGLLNLFTILLLLPVLFVIGYVTGYVLAATYNWTLKRK